MAPSHGVLLQLSTTTLIVAVVLLALPQPAAAGCLSEYGQCGECARRAMRDAILGLDISEAMDAYVEAIDCDIDLLHCLVYGHHHDYDCGA